MKRSAGSIAAMLLFLLITVVISCKKNTAGDGGTTSGEPIQTEKGLPVGLPASGMIGAAGGALTSDDGKVTITVPAGAVISNTAFRIQSITNTLTTDTDDIAYRLSPEGWAFSKPVVITFHYDANDIRNSVEDALMMCYQTDAGNWKAVPATLNKATTSLTISTMHFSDWTITRSLEIGVQKNVLSPGEETELWVKGLHLETGDLLAPLTRIGDDEIHGSVKIIKNWQIISGHGRLSDITGEETKKVYTAPMPVPQPEKVEIQVELEGDMRIADSLAPGGVRSLRKVILITSVNVMGEAYMTGKFDGKEINTSDVTALYASGYIHIAAHTPEGSYYLQMFGSSAQHYACGDILVPGNSFVQVSYVGSPTTSYSYGSEYVECGPPRVTRYSSSGVDLTLWGAIGQPVQGSFSGTLYTADGGPCDYKRKTLNVKFRTARGL